MAAGDFDGDGDEDLVLAGSRWNQRIVVLANNGSGAFTEHFTGTWGNGQTNDANEVQFADLDGDGDLDIFLLAQTWGNGPLPMVWENTGTGFNPAYSEPTGAATSLWGADASVADMDNDGDLDLVVQGQGVMGTQDHAVVIYENSGAFSFTSHLVYNQTGQSLGGVRAADMDYDGDLDLVTTTGLHWGGADNQRLVILENQGGLTFVPGFQGSQTTGTVATIVNSIAWVGDAEGDGDNEVLTGEYYAGFLWGFDSPPPAPTCEPTYQTITILGANGNPGDVDPYADASLDGGQTWQPAVLTGGPHPFDNWYFGGNMISGTNSWINYQQDWNSPSWVDEDNPLNVDFRIRFNVPEDYTDPSMQLQVRVDNEAIVKLNGVELANIDGYGSPAVPEATLNTAIQVGYNEITLRLVDYGGIIAMAYRIDLSMYSCEDLTGAVDPSEGSQNQAPTADAGADQTIDCVVESANVTLEGSGADADGDDLNYHWTDGEGTVYEGASPTLTLGGGTHNLTLHVSDGTVEATDEMTVTVNLDETAPTFAAVSEATTLWPPNHKYHTFNAADFVASADDNCTDLSSADVVITSVTSDEPEDVQGSSNGKGKKGGNSGGGDGNTKNDIVITGSSVDLRAERLGGGNGRVYTIYMAVTDDAGNTSEASAQVHVPHSKKSGAIDDGAAYSVSAGGAGLAKGGSGWNDAPLAAVPSEFGLHQNHPNPFNPSTKISYSMSEAGNASLIVYDIRGAAVSQLVEGYRSAGIHTVNFDGSDLPAGTYIYVLSTGGERFVERMLLVK
ncbi:MAG: FG-GAP-like repeat-containing protein [Candidatus Marinimicrobia bacterium]|nr:FG-GAP-like repeat-containing protein [Candidatus Neomarinimicrobiota bacterium]MCF7851403.1 FG-GAP-like repeat-containing protein [Candidatus Neomarinimicrobiota bacterium]MCF7904654.1 FG-GAP-like repeat-containing protein [Candidatus Neomarinimicrobiota bacterium]